MQTIIWAFSSMIVLLLAISILPLGYTLMGKFFVVLASLLMSLGGLAAITSFQLWQTLLILCVLALFSAYFMDKRLGIMMYKKHSPFEELFEVDSDTPVSINELNRITDDNLIETNEEALPGALFINIEKDSENEKSQSLTKPEIAKIVNNEPEMMDEDISFLLERNTNDEIIEKIEQSEPEIGYLSDIENFLAIESKEKVRTMNENELEEIHDLLPIEEEKKIHEQPAGIEEEPLNDSLFDFLLAQKEVAAERDVDTLEEIETKKKVGLQK